MAEENVIVGYAYVKWKNPENIMDLYVSAMTGSATLMMDKFVEVRSFNTATTVNNNQKCVSYFKTLENNTVYKVL